MKKGKEIRSCSCFFCKLGRGGPYGQAVRKAGNKKLRKLVKRALKNAQRFDALDQFQPVSLSTPYTD